MDDLDRYLASQPHGPTDLVIRGQPACVIEFEGLPSVNTFYNVNRWKKAQWTAEWRYEAREKAYEHTLFETDYLVKRALVVIDIHPPHEERSDIHNIYIKALLDGFSDAGVWSDDEWAFVPIVIYAWAGNEVVPHREKPKRVTQIKIYELGAYIINGTRQKLPKGRTRI